MRLRPAFRAIAALLALAPGIAAAAEPPCLGPAEFTALASYVLPDMIADTAQRCAASLPADAFLRSGAGAMAARYAAGKTAAWPGARAAFLKLGGSGGAAGEIIAGMPDTQMQQLIGLLVTSLVTEKVPLTRCSSLDAALRLLAALPPEMTVGAIALAVGLGSRSGHARLGQIAICPAAATPPVSPQP